MGDFYGSPDCPKPASHDSRNAPLPSGKPGEPTTDPKSPAGAMKGFDGTKDAPKSPEPSQRGSENKTSTEKPEVKLPAMQPKDVYGQSYMDYLETERALREQPPPGGA